MYPAEVFGYELLRVGMSWYGSDGGLFLVAARNRRKNGLNEIPRDMRWSIKGYQKYVKEMKP